MNTNLVMSISISLAAFAFSANSLAQSTTTNTVKIHPTTGVYTLSKTVTGSCLEKIKVYYSEEVDQFDILGLQPGEIVLQMLGINQGKKTYPIKNEKKEFTGMLTATSAISQNTFSYDLIVQTKYGYVASTLKLAGNFSSQSIAIAGAETNPKLRSRSARIFSCLYTKI